MNDGPEDGPEGGRVRLDPALSQGYIVRDTHLAFVKALRIRLQSHDMTPGQYFFLRALWIEEGLSQRELSQRVGTTEPTTASALRLLEKKGLVERVRNRDDRRTINIYLTGKGRALQDDLLSHAREINQAASAGIPPEDLDKVREVLRKLKGNLESEGR